MLQRCCRLRNSLPCCCCCSVRCFVSIIASVYVVFFVWALTNTHYRVRYLTMEEHLGQAIELSRLQVRAMNRRIVDTHGDTVRQKSAGMNAKQRLGVNSGYEDGILKKNDDQSVPFCEPDLSDLNYVRVNAFANITMQGVEQSVRGIQSGGYYRPVGCRPIQNVAIIIPHRNRLHHLVLLLNRLHPLLQLQRIAYQIFVIEQHSPEEFNRGMLMNVGFLEAQKAGDFDCFVFHDTDLIPEHFANLYLCNEHVHHLASAIDEMRFHVMFYNYAGGVVAISRRQFVQVNGYPNLYWGWGNEDDDFSARTLESGLLLTRPVEKIGRYKMIRHVKSSRNTEANELFLDWRARWRSDGLRTLQRASLYSVLNVTHRPLFTNVTVSLDSARRLHAMSVAHSSSSGNPPASNAGASAQPATDKAAHATSVDSASDSEFDGDHRRPRSRTAASSSQDAFTRLWSRLANVLWFLRFYFP